MLYRKMRHLWCIFALKKKYRKKNCSAQNDCAAIFYLCGQSEWQATAYRLRRHTLSADSRGLRRCIEILKSNKYEDNRRT